MLKERLLYWRHHPVKAHMSENCVSAFLEAPARWGEERMGSATINRAARITSGLCDECIAETTMAYYEARAHEVNRRIELELRRVRR